MIKRVQQRGSCCFHVFTERRINVDFRSQRHCVYAHADQIWLINRSLPCRGDADAKIIITTYSSHVGIERGKHDVEQAAARFCAKLAQLLSEVAGDRVIVAATVVSSQAWPSFLSR